MTATLAAAFGQLAGPDVAVAVQKIDGPLRLLWASEIPAMARAVPSRRAEFTAGRTAARAAMQALGLPGAAVPMGQDRAPVWPQGIVGSISHSGGLCVALVARSGPIMGLGVDLESDTALDADLWAQVCGPDELAAINLLPEPLRGRVAKQIFCAKECAYKCIYPQIQMVLGFSALEIRIDPGDGGFAATLAQPAGPYVAGTVWRGGISLTQGMICAVMVLR